MRRIVPLLALLLAGCACRSNPAELVRESGDSLANRTDQRNANTDLVPGVAIADTSANAVAAPTTGSVETQTNNNAGSPTLDLHDLFGLERQAGQIISTTSPAEAAVVRTLERTETRLRTVEDEIDALGGAATPQRAQELAAARGNLVAERDVLLGKLDAYARQKVADAQALSPKLDLSRLESIAAFVINQQHVGTERQLTDEQAKSTAEAIKALYARKAPSSGQANAGGGN